MARFLLFLLILGLAALLTALGCYRSPTGPTGSCWMGVDTLYSSGISVADTSAVRRAFQAYTAFVDTTESTFPDGATKWVYWRCEYDRKFKGVRYWNVWFLSFIPKNASPLFQCWVDVDENGTVVWPMGCI